MKPQFTSLISFVFVLELLFVGNAMAQTSKPRSSTRAVAIAKELNWPISLPPLHKDDLGSCFEITTGSVLTATTSMGTFTAGDRAVGAIIPYPGLDAKLKFSAFVTQEWVPQIGIISADLMPMHINSAGYREFRTNDEIITPLPIDKGRVIIPALKVNDYMIRVHVNKGPNRCLFLPMSVRESDKLARSN